VGVRVLEQHTMMLRALEARVQQYSDFVTLCNSSLANMRSNIWQAQAYLGHLGNSLQQARQDVAFTTALLADETTRVAQVNAQRRQVLQSAVQLIAYTRARTLEAIDTVPSRQQRRQSGTRMPAAKRRHSAGAARDRRSAARGALELAAVGGNPGDEA
jgi:hypothetical protein